MGGASDRMIKAIIMRLLTLLLVMIILAGCSDPATGKDQLEEDLSEAEVTQMEPLQAAFVDSRVEGMKGMVENEHLQLFVDEETASIAVHNKSSGEVWYSNPPDRDGDSIASGVHQDLLSSQMQLQFFNNFGQSSNMNSYTDSVVHDQFNIEAIPDGLRVNYQFGKAQRSAEDLPLMLSSERVEELLSRLDDTSQRALTIAYTENPDTGIYERNDNALRGLQLERAFTAFEEAGYTEEDLQQDMMELNFTQESAEGRVFLASIEYRLEEDSILVTVPNDRIHYTPEFPVNRISFFNFFGAADSNESGSLFVPDGSGALIHFNNGRTNLPSYQQAVYGTDLATLSRDDVRMEETARLPVFGLIKDEGEAWLAIIEEGASVASISADVSGRLNSYNYVYPSFTVVAKGDVTLRADQQERTLPRFQEGPMKTDFSVRYVFLNGEEASYQGMANYYQRYLIQNKGLRAHDNEEMTKDMPFYLQLVGNITKQQHFAGIPYQSSTSLTSFDQAEQILRQMKESEINDIKLSYIGWFNKGIDHKVPTNLRVDRAIGGMRGFEDFIAFTEGQGIKLFPETALLQVNSEAGFKVRQDASRTLTNVPAAIYPVDLSMNRRDRSQKPAYPLSPRLVEEYTEDMLEQFTVFGTTGIALRDLADILNSDFRRNDQIDRTESETISTNALERIYEEELSIMANGGNAYALPYLTDIVDIPMNSSSFKLQDESIPFLQMVIRGYVDYATVPFNLSTYLSDRDYILKVLEYGSHVNFKWIYESNEELKDTRFNQLYSVHYQQWLEQATEIYHEVNDVLKQVRGEPILSHERLAEGVYKTVYGNEIYIVVNYNMESVTVDGLTIMAQSYITGGEEK